MMVNLPQIKSCVMSDCSYNRDNVCHALAITVGGPHPACDTYYKASGKGGAQSSSGGVGACRVEICRYNVSLECEAPGIDIGHHADHADCRTFERISS